VGQIWFGADTIDPFQQRSNAPFQRLSFEPMQVHGSPTLRPSDRLLVEQIHYGSPGFTDLAGLAQAIGHVKDVLQKCLDLYVARVERTDASKRRQLENDKLAIDLVRQKIEVLKSVGYTDYQCRQLLVELAPSVASLEQLAQRQQLVGVELQASDA
jgi:hypothetical protein